MPVCGVDEPAVMVKWIVFFNFYTQEPSRCIDDHTAYFATKF